MLTKVLLPIGAALLAGFCAFRAAFRIRISYLGRLYPHDGQIGLDAMMVGVIASFVAALLAFIAVLKLLKRRDQNVS
jgi:hypothetical protein